MHACVRTYEFVVERRIINVKGSFTTEKFYLERGKLCYCMLYYTWYEYACFLAIVVRSDGDNLKTAARWVLGTYLRCISHVRSFAFSKMIQKKKSFKFSIYEKNASILFEIKTVP